MSEKDDRPQFHSITGKVSSHTTGGSMAGVTMTALVEGLDVGRSVTDKDGRYEVVIDPERVKHLTQEAEEPLSVVLRLSDSRGRVILTTERPVQVRKGADVRVDVAAPHLEHGLNWPDMTSIAGQPVNLAAAALLTAADLVQAYLCLRGRTKELGRDELVRRALPGLFASRGPQDDCGEGRFGVIRRLLAERGRVKDLDDADDYSGDLPHAFYTPHVVVLYTTDPSSPDCVHSSIPTVDEPVPLSDPSNPTIIGHVRAALADLQALDPNNTEVAPTYVQQIGIIAEYALTQYLSPSFGVRDPRRGANRIEFRIRNLGDMYGRTDPSWSHIEVAPDTLYVDGVYVTPEQNRSRLLGTVPHELWHRVQYCYNDTITFSGIYHLVREGGARFIEDCVDDAANRYVDSAAVRTFPETSPSLADSPHVSVPNNQPNATPEAGLALFWKYMAEQHSMQVGGPALGVDTYRQELEASATVEPTDPHRGYEPTTLRTARSNMPWYGSFDQFSYYDSAATELNSHETTWGNYLVANYLHGVASPGGDRRFDYLEDDEPVRWLNKKFKPIPTRLVTLQPACEEISLDRGAAVTRSEWQNAWAARYYRLVPGGTVPRMLRVSFDSSGGMSDPLLQILSLGTSDALLDIYRSDKVRYTKTINLEGVTAVVVIVASRTTPGDFTLQLDEVPSGSDTMITRWNSAVGTEYEVDPRGWSWTWTSPDVMVDNDGDGAADPMVYFNRNNTLKVRLRNRGNQTAHSLQIEFWYQKATPFLTPAGWIPVTDAAGAVQILTGKTLAPRGDPSGNDVQWFSVNWAPADDGTHHPHWCVKVKVTAPGEPNTDNKLALSNFSSVVASGNRDLIRLLLRLPEVWFHANLLIVPHGPLWTVPTVRLPLPPRPRPRPLSPRESPVRVLTPCEAVTVDLTLARSKLVPWERHTRSSEPLPGHYYPVDPRALPPGVDPTTLVTVAQVVDRRLTGGVTFQIAPPHPR